MLLIIILFTTFFLSSGVFAQQPTEKLEINVGNFASDKFRFFSHILGQVGVSYKYNVNKHYSMSASYTAWYNQERISSYFSSVNYYSPESNGVRETLGPISTWQRGDVFSRFNYHFIEASGIAKLPLRKHELYVTAGPSFALGTNEVIESAYSEPGYEDWIVLTRDERRTYFGGIVGIGYNYDMSKRISIGVSESMRFYSQVPNQYYFNINVGYKFNLLSKIL